MSDIKFIITADTKGAVTSIKKVETATKGMKDQAVKAKKPLGGMFAKLAAGAAIALAARAAIRGLVRFMGDAITKAAEQEAAEKLLNDALESTGRIVSDMLPSLLAYASELQKQTTYGDEAIIAAEALMVQLTDLDEKGLQAATRGALGMATVFKTDLKSASVLIAKALAGNFGALSRYGFQVDTTLTLEEKRIDLLKQLETLYQAAKGETETYAGKVKQLGNAYGDLKEEIGEAITENENILELIDTTKEKIVDLIESGAMEEAIMDLLLYFSALKETVDGIGGVIEDINKPFKDFGEWIRKITGGTVEADEAMGDFLLTTEGLYEPTDRLKGLLENLGGKFLGVKGAAKDSGDEVKIAGQKTGKIIPIYGDVGEAIEELLGEYDDLMEPEDIKVWVAEWESAGDNLKEILAGTGLQFGVFNDDIATDTKETTDEINQYWDSLTTDLGNSWGALFLDLTDKNSTFEESIANFFNNIRDSFRATIADMISDWVTGFLQNLIDGSASAAEQVQQNLASAIGGGDSSSVAGAFESVGAAASSLLPTFTAIASAIGAIAQIAAMGMKPAGFSEHMWYLSHIQQDMESLNAYTRIEIGSNSGWLARINDVNYLTVHRLETANGILRGIRENTADMARNLGNIPHGQSGLDFHSGGQGGLVRYHPNERITVTPNVSLQPNFNVNMQSTPVNIYLDSRLMAQGVAKHVPGLSKDGHWKMHQRGIVSQ